MLNVFNCHWIYFVAAKTKFHVIITISSSVSLRASLTVVMMLLVFVGAGLENQQSQLFSSFVIQIVQDH